MDHCLGSVGKASEDMLEKPDNPSDKTNLTFIQFVEITLWVLFFSGLDFFVMSWRFWEIYNTCTRFKNLEI